MSAADRQEAESHKYEGAIVVPLSSGRMALYDNRRQLVYIYDTAESLWTGLSSFKPWREPPRANPPQLSLEDIGL